VLPEDEGGLHALGKSGQVVEPLMVGIWYLRGLTARGFGIAENSIDEDG